MGLLDLQGKDHFDKLKRFFLEADTPDCLDLIDLTFHVIDVQIRDRWKTRQHSDLESPDEDQIDGLGIKQASDDALTELNRRFREHSIGYEYVGALIYVSRLALCAWRGR